LEAVSTVLSLCLSAGQRGLTRAGDVPVAEWRLEEFWTDLYVGWTSTKNMPMMKTTMTTMTTSRWDLGPEHLPVGGGGLGGGAAGDPGREVRAYCMS
jgi:hypothetical protein